ncbi:hypothetical protein GOBAR_AA35901 [Gossypium barbadense]|uniref:Uncharacterized protein n=1 Tax=Gossypium barbadense TaxID=3634 RepID=A0A2P5W169_GOSBA|nr:hypothetical protein GOBAR_AA35901 [Gossypium barbadense]
MAANLYDTAWGLVQLGAFVGVIGAYHLGPSDSFTFGDGVRLELLYRRPQIDEAAVLMTATGFSSLRSFRTTSCLRLEKSVERLDLSR